MGTAKQPQPVKLIASVFAGSSSLLESACHRLEEIYGSVDYQSEQLPFDHTDYYRPEFGPGLKRIIMAFEQLVDPGDMAAIKQQTNFLESEWSIKSSESSKERRQVNIDPGYLSLSKLVLATTKNHAHRIYLSDGIYAEVTLHYRDGAFRSFPWTYPDYAGPRYCALFAEIRNIYHRQLRGL
ncbi:MAG: hypothetical protein B6I34_06995 [Anaerolineaceae bacterium 4572_32.1]|nr:MAG: hypothetical protein B6I34_06995 [Anaerolineaceae bacterium 4572_32.1]